MSSTHFQAKTYTDRIQSAARRALFTVEPYGMVDRIPLLALTREAQTPDREPLPHPTATLYLSAGVHGDEPSGPLALLRLLNDRWFAPDISWTLFPLINPSGMSSGSRESAEGIDLNRQYFQRNAYEVDRHLAWLENRAIRPHYDLSLMLHEDWEARGFYLYELCAVPERSIASAIIKEIERSFPIESSSAIDGYASADGIINPLDTEDFDLEQTEDLPGAEAIYVYKHYSSLNYTLETPSTVPIAERISTHIRAVQTAIQAFLKVPGHSRPG